MMKVISTEFLLAASDSAASPLSNREPLFILILTPAPLTVTCQNVPREKHTEKMCFAPKTVQCSALKGRSLTGDLLCEVLELEC